MKILINYAHNEFYASQKANSASGLANGFDGVYEYGYANLDPTFCKKNEHILKHKKGAGYWLWKPQIILQTFDLCKEGDYVFYCDSGAKFIASIDPLLPLCDYAKGVMLFHLSPEEGNYEFLQTKGDAFKLMDCMRPEIFYTVPLLASFQLYKNCTFARDFVKELLRYCEDERILTDMENTVQGNFDGFINHRHDQSVLSCLQKKMRIPAFTDPSQFGNGFRKPDDGYGQIINHTRNRD
jgi:hypothetical protein